MADYFDEQPKRKTIKLDDPVRALKRIIREVYAGDTPPTKGRVLADMLGKLKVLEEHSELKAEVEKLKEAIYGKS